MQTLQHIPIWVFALLIGLVALGLQQSRTRQMPKQRLLGINISLTIITLIGVIQQWRHTPWLVLSLLSWTATCSVLTWTLGQEPAPAGARYNAENRSFTVPGSWLPLSLFMAIFACKFIVGMLNATAPEQLFNLNAALGISALYGVLSGLLNARTWRLLKLQKGTNTT